MDISQINSNFGPATEPRDDTLMDLLRRAYAGEIPAIMAIADMRMIVPFSDFRPAISAEYRQFFNEKLQVGTPPGLYVYVRDGKLIMSDDYNAYYMYRQLNLPKARCVVIGDSPPIIGVEYSSSGPFRLPIPRGVTRLNN